MSFFDENGKLNESFAQQVYNQAGGQVTGQLPAGVPILGAGIEFEDVAKAPWEAVDQCIDHLKEPLSQGAPPESPVMVALLQFAQIMRLLDSLRPTIEAEVIEEEEQTDPKTSLGQIFAALGQALVLIQRYAATAPTPEEREQAKKWLDANAKHAQFLNSAKEDQFRLHLDPKE